MLSSLKMILSIVNFLSKCHDYKKWLAYGFFLFKLVNKNGPDEQSITKNQMKWKNKYVT